MDTKCTGLGSEIGLSLCFSTRVLATLKELVYFTVPWFHY